ncbi:hypothetical protein CO661_14280 [Sinorhizobium fredii]|uniref:Uncharacterized protein n=1 Tax=Rhizobium fredii TaxID=380 RepID=A0A2A6LYN7_RHIFR|nr:hypothetical protein [Sinorhizobium fredii]PDT47346.1 hypothetical protein CO661_14280 [Sinorhizobium fredii]
MSREFLIWLGALVVGALIALFYLSSAASAQESCGPRRQVIDALREHYGEVERGYGIETGKKATVLLLLVNEETDTWTILRVQPDVACGVASGTDFTLLFGDPA